jgi:predicted transcriptional regulator
MDVVYRLGSPTAAQIAKDLPDPPSYSAVRALLSILVSKGHLTTQMEGNRYLYSPAVSRKVASKKALRDMVANFFGGSPKQAVVALLGDAQSKISDGELEEIRQLIEAAKTGKR